MIKNERKMRVSILIFGIIMFAVLAFSTVVKSDILEDYTNFQIFRSQLNINQYDIKRNFELSKDIKKDELNSILHELDLTLHVLKDSSFLSVYRSINKRYSSSMDIVESEMNNIIELFFNETIDPGFELNTSLGRIMTEVDSADALLATTEKRYRIFYTVVLSLNLLAFAGLLVFVFYLTNIKEKTGGGSIMSVRNALIQGQEQERLRISLELHDKVAQDLFASKMIINDIITNVTDDSLSKSFNKALNLLDMSIKEVRDLSYSLRPPALQAIGLDSAIQSYVDSFSKKIETPIAFKAVGMANKVIDESVSINLYRILQETLNNTAKHAHAENIDVKLIFSYPFLLLKIEDDGVGFNYVKSEIKAKGREKLGLPGINERVSLLGGELIINSSKGEGTKILIKVPVEGNEKV